MWHTTSRLRDSLRGCHTAQLVRLADAVLTPRSASYPPFTLSILRPFSSAFQVSVPPSCALGGPTLASCPGESSSLGALMTSSAHTGAARGTSLLQSRGVQVEVKNGDVDRALKKYKWKLREDNALRMLRARRYNYKPSEMKVLFRKEGEIRRKQRMFKDQLNWIMSKRSRGF